MLNIRVHPRTGEAFIAESAAAAADAPAARPLWEIRTEERPYAFVPSPPIPERNRWGETTDLLERAKGRAGAGRSLHINDNPAVGANPNRNRQHGFYFNADHCIGCHACEAACSEKNENPPHIAFRSVGYLEGGSWPDFQRLNISMACNHCDDPVCLKGCPTRAYTKHTEYGAVLQDPETCFGCGYCTWVCPYNAPQLDPVKGQVSKCNLCVDRLEVGLKPACVAACVGNALDFGVIDTVPERREQAEVQIPGFPTPGITRPNIRFQQTRQLPDELVRTDSAPVKYRKGDNGTYRPMVDAAKGPAAPQWNLKRLSSRENPLVLFTLAAQAAIGAFTLLVLGRALGWPAFVAFATSGAAPLFSALALGLVAFGLFMSTLHLGKPMRFYRGFNNLRHSPVSREALGVALFIAALGVQAAGSVLLQPGVATSIGLARWREGLGVLNAAASALAVLAGLVGLAYMARCYRIAARPFWNHPQVSTAFFGTALSMGAPLLAAVMLPALAGSGDAGAWRGAALALSLAWAAGLALEGAGLLSHAHDMRDAAHEGAASHHQQRTTFGKTYATRNALMAMNLALLGAATVGGLLGAPDRVWAATLVIAAVIQVVIGAVGRALFYVLVVPTTMPGAFFWKNRDFEEHARAVGLAERPQVGVPPSRH